MTKLTTARKINIKEWYFKGSYIPGLGTTQFAGFAGHGYSLLNEVAGKLGTAPIAYKIDKHAPTAYWDADHRTIALPGWYFVTDGVKNYSDGKEISLDALTLINGSTIHEALHAKYTTTTPSEVINSIAIKLGTALNMEVAGTIANLTEDVYIESRSLTTWQTAWLAAKNDLLFNNELFAKACSTFKATDAYSIAQMTIFYKRTELRDKLTMIDPRIIEELDKLSARSVTVFERMMITKNIIELINIAAETAKEAEKVEGKDGGEKSDAEADADGESESTTPSRSVDAEGAEIGKEMDKTLAEAVEENSKAINSAMRAFAASVKAAEKEKDTEKKISARKLGLDEIEKHIRVVDVMEHIDHDCGAHLENIRLSNRFATLLKQMRTVLPTRGRAKTTGGKLDVLRLSNVAIDNKVFSNRTIDAAGRNDKVEIALLIDASGSMYGRLFTKAISVSHKIFKALVGSGVETKAFMHTSYYRYEYFPLVVKIASNINRNVDNRFTRALGMELHENLDGMAIKEVIDHQMTSDVKTKKVLIVLSDGAPQSPNYEGSGIGSTHTKHVIDEARKAGVAIYSLSLTTGVVDANNNIYGREFNVDASRDLDKEMTNLVTKLVTRK